MTIWMLLLTGIILYFIFYSVYARFVEKRSVISRIFQDSLTVGNFLFSSMMSKGLKTLQQKGRKPFVWPEKKTKHSVAFYDVNGMDVYKLNETGGFPKKILYLHGGAYVFDLTNMHIRLVDSLASRMDSCIHIPNYPLAPEANYRESYEKMLALYEKLIERTPAEDVILMGDSAGGGFCLGLALLIKEKGLPQPGELILLSPWLDITMTNPLITKELEKKDKLLSVDFLTKAGKLWVGEDDPKSYLVSPINGDLEGLPPITIFTGTYDLLYPDVQRLHEKLKSIGAENELKAYDKMLHDFPIFPIPEGKQVIDEIIERIQ
ncbi:MAG TPA: alpha/beta hydrolase [Thermotogota bacterium]|nr:alpha/beta hydrolase [Thermotogota bacterium]HRW35371.1 alpha/beta hydrolase [Thermotogota bacterium]